MAETNTVARTVRDLGLANWFGGSLMGAVGLNGSAQAVSDPRQRSRVPRAGWQRWTGLEAAGILAVVAGDTVLIASRPQHLAAQHGYTRHLAIKLAVNGPRWPPRSGPGCWGGGWTGPVRSRWRGRPSQPRAPRRRRPAPSVGCGSCSGRSRC